MKEQLKTDLRRQDLPVRDLKGLRICSRCIYDEKVPGIEFDENGVCNYCRMIDGIKAEYGTETESGERRFDELIREIKKAGSKRKYDCVVGVSGGTDSSYMLYLTVSKGLRPLAVHYDNTWNSAIATENIRKVTKALGVDLYTHVVDNKESDDIFKSFLTAGVPELDGPTDIALAEVLYRAASKYNVKYIIEGHSFLTEGISPLGTHYVDGKYIQTIHRKFGKIKMKTFPNLTLTHFLYWIIFKRIKKVRPFWYIKYSKEDARAFLEKEYGWKYYGGHHLENRMTAFWQSYYLPVRFGNDQRNNSLAASARSGRISREEAIRRFAEPPHLEQEILEYFLKRLELSDDEFLSLINAPLKSYRDYKTYKKTFERLRPMFYLLAKANLVPMSFYIKYTSKNEL